MKIPLTSFDIGRINFTYDVDLKTCMVQVYFCKSNGLVFVPKKMVCSSRSYMLSMHYEVLLSDMVILDL